MKLLKTVTFSLFLLLIIVLVIATVLEKIYGTYFATNIYGSYWFVALWAGFAVSCILYVIRCRLRKMSLLIHTSLFIILCGAFITWVSGQRGYLNLQTDKPINEYIDNDGNPNTFPFTVCLDSFRVECYKGTNSPMDYISTLHISSSDGETKGIVSMNNIFSYKSYRFYQSGYDESLNSSSFYIVYDPYGIAVTYTGYLLLLLSWIGFFFDSKSRFRQLLKSPLLQKTFIIIVFFFGGTLSAVSADIHQPKTLPKEVAQKFGELYVLYNGRICPLQTLAKDFTVKLYGKSSYRGFSCEQVFTGWMFYYSSWKSQPVIKIKKAETRQKLGIKTSYASLDDFYDSYGEYKLKGINGCEDANEKFGLISMLYSGQLLSIYPHLVDNTLSWYAQSDNLPAEMKEEKWIFIKKSMDYIHEKVIQRNYPEITHLLQRIRAYQIKEAGELLPSSFHMAAERFYNKCDIRWVAMLCLLIGISAFIYYCIRIAKNKSVHYVIKNLMRGIAVLIFLYLFLLMGLRWYIGGHLPLASGFETMQFMSWCSFLLIFLLQHRFSMVLPFGFLMGGLTLLVAMMGESNPQITLLMPVLKSPLLCIHVVIIMLAYALLAFIMLNGVMALLIARFSDSDGNEQIDRLQVISQLMLYPAVFCLAVGIFIGSVWANISWGRYWGWDPKEVWALITLLVYSLALHGKSSSLFNSSKEFHIFSIIAFLSVLITYFGVNFILGGMHSYA